MKWRQLDPASRVCSGAASTEPFGNYAAQSALAGKSVIGFSSRGAARAQNPALAPNLEASLGEDADSIGPARACPKA